MGLKNSKPKVDEINDLLEETPNKDVPEKDVPEKDVPENYVPEKDVPEEFKRIDENEDDLMTWKEFEEAFEEKHGRKMDRNDLWSFLAMDRDGDTNVSLKEWNAYHSQEGWD